MTETPPEAPKKRRWLMPLLLVSLGVNLLVAGLVIGAMLSPDGPRKRGEYGPSRGVIGEPFVRALPHSERRALMQDVHRDRERIRESRESLRQRFEAFLVALRADPFDSSEISRLLAEQRKAAVGRQEIGEALLMKRLEAMTAEQRAAYADALEESLNRFRKR